MQLQFTKMHGLGNDFVLLDGVRCPLTVSSDLVRRLADRHLGIGCDQVLLIEPTRNPEADFRYRIFNADGGEVQQCGNGSRCVARYLQDENRLSRSEVTVETAAGLIRMYLLDAGRVKVDMGCPRFAPESIPFIAEREADSYLVAVDAEQIPLAALSMGNPHAVLRVAELDSAPVARLGPLLGSHPRFPEGVNIGFMQIVDARHVRLRVYERGAGETLACGTGACAAVVAGRCGFDLAPEVEVSLPGGRLTIEWQGRGHSVWMTGPAVRVFDGCLTDDDE
jgi:diaminopimelate epimerase